MGKPPFTLNVRFCVHLSPRQYTLCLDPLARSRWYKMNNEQFRKLLLANSAKSPSGAQDGASPSPRASGGAGSSALGSRLKSSIPMTP